MTHLLKLAILAAATTALAAPPALAFDCGPDRIISNARNYLALQSPGMSHEVFGSHRVEITMDAKRCPETGWIQIIAAGAELKWMERLEAAAKEDGNDFSASAFKALETATSHILAVQSDIPERLRHGGLELDYDEWTQIVEVGVSALTRYGDAGHVHPLVSDTPPQIGCNSVTTAMATNASNFRFTRSPAALRLLTSVANVCRPSEDKLKWQVLAQRSASLVRQVEEGIISEPHRIRWALREAHRDTRQYLDGREAPVGIWFESREKALQDLLEKYPDSLIPETPMVEGIAVRVRAFADKTEIPRADWFRPDEIGKDAAVYSIALDLSGAWTDVSAGITDADTETVGKDRVRFMNHFRAIEAEADARGQGKAGREMLLEALAAFQTGAVRSRETADLPPAPGWMYRVMHNVTQAKIDAAE